jgi:dihydroxy-acid dehydratase
MVLQNAGPKSASGMPEAGYLPIPKKLSQNGVKDMVRISDARMSGTAFGTIILHVTPESSIGGTLGLVQNGDPIKLSVQNKSIELLVDETELNRRRACWVSNNQEVKTRRGYDRIYAEQVLQADEGCDFAILQANPETNEEDSEK